MRKSQIVCCFIVVSLLCGNHFARAADPTHPDQPIVSPTEAISRLKEGNGRFTAGNAQHPHESTDERKYMATNSYENAGMIFLGMTAEQAAKETIAAKGKAPAHIQSLVNAIRPAVEATMNSDLEATVKANVKDVVQALRTSTPILKPQIDSGAVRVIGGYYSLDTGSVTFL